MAFEFGKPKVLIFEDSGHDFFRDLALRGADAAGWDALAFQHPGEALHHFDERVSALITSLGTNGPFHEALQGRYPAIPLIRVSNDFDIPRAMVSGHPLAELYTRLDSKDMCIDKTNTLAIPAKLSEWLVGLAVRVR